MRIVSFQEFDSIYQKSSKSIYEYWTTQMQADIATHCYLWRPGLFDFRTYLQASSIRFYKAYRSFAAEENVKTVCDIGGFWGVFPITLKSLGYDVAMTESLKYYNDSFQDLFKYIAEQGVAIFDYDPFQPNVPSLGCFDVITVMAILEHYPHSLKDFMKNIISLISPEGQVYMEVPNIAFWPKRINFLLGQTPLVKIEHIYNSEVPFIGHHHEFTLSELRNLVALSGLSVISENLYNYSPGTLPGIKTLIRHPFWFIVFSMLKDSRECLAVSCKLKK
jgi:2-polyprenyl-3-methyl-5-hydroxy-6-metoxy-1,4-benzoquinol methylase